MSIGENDTNCAVNVISENEIRNKVFLNEELIEVIEEAFVTLAKDTTLVPAVQQLAMPETSGAVCIKSAYCPKLPYFAVKMVGAYPHNHRNGMGMHQGCVCLFDARHGKIDTVFEDNGWLTQLRTAAAGAVAAKYLAPKKVDKVGVLGAGHQAKLQLHALSLVRDIDQVFVHSRTRSKSKEFASWTKRELGITTTLAENTKDMAFGANVILTTTKATQPVLSPEHLDHETPLHITAMGSDTPDKIELDSHIFNHCDRFVCDLIRQSRKIGELRLVEEKGLLDDSKVEELGRVCVDQSYRQPEDRLTVCDLTGTGILDLAIAIYAKNKII